MKTKPVSKIYAELRTALTATVLSFNGIIEQLPEALRAKLTDSRKGLDESIAGLPDPKDIGDETSLNAALEVMARDHEVLLESVSTLTAQLKGQATSLNEFTALQKRVADGDLIEKAKAQELAGTARKEGEQIAQTRITMLASRREAIVKAGLPSPADSELDGDEAAFKVRQETATKRATELKAKGVSLNGVIGQSVWADEAAYQRDLKLVSEFASRTGPNPFATGAGGAGGPRVAMV